jgi:hypothetical protein
LDTWFPSSPVMNLPVGILFCAQGRPSWWGLLLILQEGPLYKPALIITSSIAMQQDIIIQTLGSTGLSSQGTMLYGHSITLHKSLQWEKPDPRSSMSFFTCSTKTLILEATHILLTDVWRPAPSLY